MISNLTLHHANKGAEQENTLEAIHSELEMESKEKVNEDMEIHSRIDPETDTIEGPLAQRNQNEISSYGKGHILVVSPNITYTGDMAQDLETSSM